MKNKRTIFLSFIAMALASGAFSQNIFPASGRAGINTVNPATALHVIGGARIGNTTNFVNIDSATGNLAFAGNAGYRVGGNKYVFQYNGNPNYGLFFNQTNVRYEFRNSAAAPTFYIGADNGTGYFAGNLGIGNTDPIAKLDISGNIKIADGTQGSGKVLVSDADGLASWQTIPAGISGTGAAGNLTYWTASNSIGSNSNLFWDNTNNRLGIGNSTPIASLDLNGNIRIADGTQAAGKILVSDQNGFASWQPIPTSISGSGSTGNVSIWTGTSSLGYNNDFFWDNTNSRLGIGTLTPTTSLDVVGKIRLADGSQGTGKVLVSDANGIGTWQTAPSAVTGSGVAGNLAIWSGTGAISSNTGLFWDNTSRRLGIGSTTLSARLDVIGTIKITDGTQGTGKILTSDANGLAFWQTPPTILSGSGNSGNLTFWNGSTSLGANTNLYWDNINNRLGIGNNTPTASLDLAGNVKIADGTQGAGKVLVSDANGLASWQAIPPGISGTGAAGNLTYWTASSSIGANSNLFWDNTNNRLGVGNSTPIASLDLNGNIRIADGTQAAGKALISDQNGFASWQTIPVSIAGSGSTGNVSIWTGTTSLGYNNNFFWDNTNSRLGIGTLTPTTSLDVIGKIRLADGSQGAGKVLISDVNGIGTWSTIPPGVSGSGAAGNVAIWSGTGSISSNTNLFWDNINRRLGIGSATPAARLDILGNIKITDGTQGAGKILTSDANGLAFWQTPPTILSGSGNSGNLTFWNGSTSLGANTNLYWDNINNRLGIGNNTPTASLDLAGNVKIADGTQGTGKVLTSDANGVASWQAVPPGISGTGAAGNLTYWTASSSIGANSNLFWDNANNRLGINTVAPTHSLTLASTGDGLSVYNTSDQTTNYERLGLSWQSNVVDIGTFFGGTGTPRQIRIGIQQSAGATSLASGRVMTIAMNPTVTKGVFDFQANTGSIGNVITAGGNFTQSSGVTRLMDLHPVYSQTSTAGYTVIRISPFEGGTGSGAKLLIDAGTNSAGNGGGTHTSKFSVDNNGKGYFASNLGIGNTNPVAKLDVAGNIKITDGTQGVGKVLTSDANGLAFWQAPPTIISGSGSSGNLTFWSGSTSLGANTNLYWDNTNNRLGIGNNTPTASLDLAGNVKIADGTQGSGKVLVSDANGLASWQTIPPGISGTGANGNISFWNGTNSLSANTNLFWNNTNNRLGIGNSNPSAVVDINGNVKITDGTQGTGKVLTSDANGFASWQVVPPGITGTGANGNISFWSGPNSLSANTNLFWNNINNRLGIGNSNPSATIDINGNIKIADGSQGAGKALISDANGVASWQTVGASSWTGSGNNIYSNNAGNVGIGTNTPLAKLQVTGDVILTDSSDNSNGNVTIGSPNSYLTSKLYVKSTLTYGAWIEAPTVSQWGLYVNGSLYVNGTAAKPGSSTWTVLSDERLKSNIKPYTEGLEQVMKINPVKYHYNSESGLDTKNEYVGVVAQQLEKVAPYMVGKYKRNTDKKEFLDVDNSAMTYMLINAVKELKADADIKETTIKDQQQQIDQLQRQMVNVLQKLNELQAVQQQCCSVTSAEIMSPGNQSIVLSDVARLEQNLPNPFKNKTIIKYHLPANANNAQLIVTNNSGKTINTVKLSGKAEGQVTLDAGILSPGTYYYSLFINGNKADTKKMEILR